MSSCMIIQEHDRFTFSVDTAHCAGDCNLLKYRVRDFKVQKVHKAGRDMIFIAGMTECTEQLKNNLYRFINKRDHLNIELLKQYLKREFPREKSKYKDTGLNDIGCTIFSVINNESILYSFGQNSNYDGSFISKSKPGQIKLFADGFDGDRIYAYAHNYLKSLRGINEYRDPNTFIHTYQHNYSEGVGGYIQVYSMDCNGCNMIREQKLEEENLRYCTVVSASENSSIELTQLFQSHISASQIHGGTISGTDIDGVNITGGTISGTDIGAVNITGSNIDGANITGGAINGAHIISQSGNFSTSIYNGQIVTDYVELSTTSEVTQLFPGEVAVRNQNTGSEALMGAGYINTPLINGGMPITSNNIDVQSVLYASNAHALDNTVYISSEGNFRPYNSGIPSCGTSLGKWSSVWAVSGTIQTSDVNKKNSINDLDDKYEQFINMVVPKSFKMNEGTSGRTHIGFIAQEVEAAMTACGITDMEFAGLIKAPVYTKKLLDKDGNELPDYDITSEVIGYDYGLRYEEFIPLLLARIIDQEERLCAVENLLNAK